MLVLLCSPPRQPQRLTSGERWLRNFHSKLPTDIRVQQAVRSLVAQLNAVVLDPVPFHTLRPQFVQPPTHDAAILEPAIASDHVRHLARSVKLCYTRQNAPVLPPVPNAAREDTGALAVIPSRQATVQFPPPRQSTAMFGNITVHYDAWSDYVEPTVYALRDQQRIVNWTDVRGLTFSGDGLQYIQCLQLHHTSERPIAINDNIVFLYCPTCAFTPEQPCRSLFSVTHVRYIVVHNQGPIYYFDRVDILYNFVDMDPLFPKIKCAYVGTYLLFVRQHDLTQDVPTTTSNVTHGQQLVPSNCSSAILPTSGRNSLRRPSTDLPSTTGPAAGSS